MLILIILFFSSLIPDTRAKPKRINVMDLLNNYTTALYSHDRNALYNMLSPNFTLYDCHEKPRMNRDEFIDKIHNYDVDKDISVRRFMLRKIEWSDDLSKVLLLLNVSGGYDYIVLGATKDGQILFEVSRICQTVDPIATSLIDDFEIFAITITRRYFGALMRIYHFEEILHPEFTITRCDGSVISRDQLLKIYNYTDGNIVPIFLDDNWLPSGERDDNQTFSFDIKNKNSIIHLESVMVNGKHRLISETQKLCENFSESSGLIDEPATKIKTIQSLGEMYNDAVNKNDLELFQRITWENMTIKMCSKSQDILMRRDDYFRILLALQHKQKSMNYTNVKDLEGDLLTGEFRWSIYNDSSPHEKHIFETRPNPETGKLIIISEERWQCLSEEELDSYQTFFQDKMQKLIDNFVEAVNAKNTTQFRKLTANPFMVDTRSRKKLFSKKPAKFRSVYRAKLPKLTVYTKPTIVNEFIKFSAKGEWLDNQYFAKIVDWKYVLVNETRRDFMADFNRLDKEYFGQTFDE